jgi:general secretion pathway protein G
MKRKLRQSGLPRRAFTLLEVLMVVVIIGILAALVVPNFFGAQEGAKEDLTRALVDSGVNGTLDMYRMHMGRYPTTDEGLAALIEEPDDEELAEKWRGPYLKEGAKLQDAWGHDLIYESPGQYNENTYDLSSPGKDGQEGTEDDITNWEKT